jgi:Trypsin-like serine proteases, typically periplasmic, contain C-terminal PDZ domain
MEIIASIARKLIEAFLLNYLFVFLYIIIIVFIRMQYDKYSDLQSGIENWQGKSLKEITESIIFVGLVTGFIGSFVIIGTGITIDGEAVKYLFFIMGILLLINIRLVCFAYPAGLLALMSLVLKFPTVDVSSILALAAIMHLIESILIYLNKGRDSIPVFIKHKGEIAGAYLIRKFWPVPVVFLTVLTQNTVETVQTISSGWWMLFKPQTLQNGAMALGLDCVIAVLCYSDLAITRHPEKKSKSTAYAIFGYSIALFIIAIISRQVPWMRFVGALFCILVREAITLCGRYIENNGKPLFSPTRRGLKVMEILPGSHAKLMGMQRGDTILSVNSYDIQTEEGLTEALKDYPVYTWIQVVGWDGKEKTYDYRCYPSGYNNLGIIPVPREGEVTYNTDKFEHMSIIKNIVTRFKGINKV